MTAIYAGDGTNAYESLPVQASTNYNSYPFVVPVTHLSTTVCPNWDSICTYGYNLTVNDYRGRFTDIGNTPFDGGAGQSCSVAKSKATTSGLTACFSTSYYTDFYPTFSSQNSAKQKIRGRLYSAYDSSLGVAAITKNESDWPSGSSISSNPMYAYRITNSSEQLWIKGGWMIIQFSGNITNCLVQSCTCDTVWSTGTTAVPQWELDSKRMILTSDDIVAKSTLTIPHAYRNFTASSGIYQIIRLGSCMVGKGNILMSAPRFRVYRPTTATYTANLIQFGITFGTADS